MPAAPRCSTVAILGAPNAGKSTLLNALVGTKVSIVTPKVQTTRSLITGVGIAGDAQLIFLDTPGIFVPKQRLEKAMVAAAWKGAKGADLSLVMVDARRSPNAIGDDTEKIIDGLRGSQRSAVLALNKIDCVDRPSLLALTAALAGEGSLFTDVFMISALNGDGVADLKAHLGSTAPYGPWLYPRDQLSGVPMRFMAQEITREKLFLALHEELPYSLALEHIRWEDRADGSVRIDQNVLVSREAHKRIVVGKGGTLIRNVGQAARVELEDLLSRKVHLFLNVKVRERWTKEPNRYRDMGLDFHSGG